MTLRIPVISILALTLTLSPFVVSAQLSSTNYQMDVFGAGENSVGDGASTNFQTTSSVGPNFTYDTTTDTDGDGIPDSTENTNGTDPNNPNDPTASGAGDDDGDGVTNAVEVLIGTNSTSTTPSQDTDGDGISDVIEVALGTDWTDGNDPVASGGNDGDSDGVTDAVESAICTAYPSLAACSDVTATADSDGDGIPDVTEFLNGHDPTDSNNPTINGANDDDGDGIPNGREVFNGTDPNDENDPNPQSSGGGGGGGSSSSSDDDEVSDESQSDAAIEGADTVMPDSVADTGVGATQPEAPVIVPTTFISPDSEDVQSDTDQAELEMVRSAIDQLLTTEDATSDRDKLVLVIDRRVYALLPDQNGAYGAVADFTDGQVTVTIPAGALGEDYEGPLSIVITQQNLDEQQHPDRSHQPNMLGRYTYDIRVFTAAGVEITSFEQAIEVVIVVPDELQGRDGLGVYFINEDIQQWERVSDVRFVGREAIFTVDHLTTFAIWATADTPDAMAFDEGVVSDLQDEGVTQQVESSVSTSQSGFIWSWWWLILIVITLLGVWLYRNRTTQ